MWLVRRIRCFLSIAWRPWEGGRFPVGLAWEVASIGFPTPAEAARRLAETRAILADRRPLAELIAERAAEGAEIVIVDASREGSDA